MLYTPRAKRGMVVAPHALAAQAGLAVLREGGNAAEAAVSVAATLAVVYPHMTGIGGDAFWLLAAPGQQPVAVDGAGRTPAELDLSRYAGLAAVPTRGPLAALTVPGAVSAWAAALEVAARWGGRLPLARLLEEAVAHARGGYAVTASQARATRVHAQALGQQPGFAEVFFAEGAPRPEGALERQPALAETLERLGAAGCEDFYRGELAAALAEDLAAVGSPVTGADLAAQRARVQAPLELPWQGGRLYNVGPPCQGLASLMILGLYERAGGPGLACDGADHVHLLVEATKRAFALRDAELRDPRDMGLSPADLLAEARLAALAADIDMRRAAPWGRAGEAGDTTWFAVVDGEGRAVSAIQSIYHEFGSGVVLPRTGVCWQNRGIVFELDPAHPRALRPGRQPFHTLNPAMAELADGRFAAYGTMGGDGQPQTQAAVITRIAVHGMAPQAAVSAPRWLLGRTWGSPSQSLKLEARLAGAVGEALRGRGHAVEVVEDYAEMMGHAGVILRRPDGLLEGAADPRGDGLVAAY